MPKNKVFGQAEGGRARRSFGCAIVSLLGRVWGMRVDGIEGNKCGWGEVGNGG